MNISELMQYEIPTGKALGMRTCSPDMKSYGGFVWPKQGDVIAPDWSPHEGCGGGLHYLLYGEGDGSLLSFAEGSVWMIIEVEQATAVDLTGKYKSEKANVLFCGSMVDVCRVMQRFYPEKSLVGGTAIAGNDGTATVGYRGAATAGVGGTATAGVDGTAIAGNDGTATVGYRGAATAGVGGTATAGVDGAATAGVDGAATAGDRGIAIAGNDGTATVGYRGIATAGRRGTAIAGNDGTATVGYRGTATAGYRGIATAGVDGTATAGDRGTAIAGDDGTAIAGDDGTATVGVDGTATAGDRGIIEICFLGPRRRRIKVGYIGEDGLLPDTNYRLDREFNFEKV